MNGDHYTGNTGMKVQNLVKSMRVKTAKIEICRYAFMLHNYSFEG